MVTLGEWACLMMLSSCWLLIMGTEHTSEFLCLLWMAAIYGIRPPTPMGRTRELLRNL
jgi:hypothetical protein